MWSVKGRIRRPRPAARTMAFLGVTDIRFLKTDQRCGSYHGDSTDPATVRAIVIADDGCKTTAARGGNKRIWVRGRSRVGGLRAALAGLLLLVALLEEIDADLVAIDPGQLTAAVGEAGGRQQQEEFLQMQTLDGAFDGQLGPGLGDVFHDTFAPPGTIDAHHVRRITALECD